MWSKARQTLAAGSINFATSGIIAIGGSLAYVEGKISKGETLEERRKDGPAAKQTLELLLCAHAIDLFQTYLADLVLEIVTKDPRPLRGRTVPVSVAFDCVSIEDVRKSIVDRYVLELGYQNVDDLTLSLQKNFGLVSLRNPLTRLCLRRYVQMRNIITHNRGICNSIYLEKSKSKSDRVGEVVRHYKPIVAARYITGLADRLDAEAVTKFGL